MKLLDELKERREAVANRLEDVYLTAEPLRAEIEDLDRAIEVLEPQPSAYPEQLPEPTIAAAVAAPPVVEFAAEVAHGETWLKF